MVMELQSTNKFLIDFFLPLTLLVTVWRFDCSAWVGTWETSCKRYYTKGKRGRLTWMKERNRLRVATQTARRRQIRSSAALPLLFTPSLSLSLYIYIYSFHAPFCSGLGYLFIFRLSFSFLSFSSHFSSPLHEEEEETRNQFPALQCHPCALRIGNLALLKLACASSSLRLPFLVSRAPLLDCCPPNLLRANGN
jgi:hypothetical protein